MPNGFIKHYNNNLSQGMIEPSDHSPDVFLPEKWPKAV